MDEIRYRGDYLMKLTLSDMNLGDDVIVDAICETILAKKILQYIDLSRAGFFPNHLSKISETIRTLTKSIRDFNFSYNRLYPA